MPESMLLLLVHDVHGILLLLASFLLLVRDVPGITAVAGRPSVACP